MSTRAGGTTSGSLEAGTDVRCRWQLCDYKVPYRFYREQMYLCRDHAILVWSIINTQLAEGQEMPGSDRKERLDGERAKSVGYVYYIAVAGRIKIGHTKAIEQRLASYPPGMEILYVQDGSRADEAAAHKRFRKHLSDGREWFTDCAEVRDAIEKLCAADGGWDFHADLDWVHRRRHAS